MLTTGSPGMVGDVKRARLSFSEGVTVPRRGSDGKSDPSNVPRLSHTAPAARVSIAVPGGIGGGGLLSGASAEEERKEPAPAPPSLALLKVKVKASRWLRSQKWEAAGVGGSIGEHATRQSNRRESFCSSSSDEEDEDEIWTGSKKRVSMSAGLGSAVSDDRSKDSVDRVVAQDSIQGIEDAIKDFADLRQAAMLRAKVLRVMHSGLPLDGSDLAQLDQILPRLPQVSGTKGAPVSKDHHAMHRRFRQLAGQKPTRSLRL